MLAFVQNCLDAFLMFCMKGKMDGGLSIAGKRSLVMLQTYRCGTSYEVTDVIQSTLKTMPEEFYSHAGQTTSASSGEQSAKSLPKRKLGAVHSFIDSVWKDFNDFTPTFLAAMEERRVQAAIERNQKNCTARNGHAHACTCPLYV